MNISDLSGKLKKELGDSFITSAKEVANVERVPTGIYPVDYATGGGFPRGMISILWGAEGSTKTNLALKAIANNQLLNPDQTNVFIDMEHSFDPKWAELHGVDLSEDKFALFKPQYGEQAVDILQKVIQAEDAGVVVLDSIGDLTTVNEYESTSDKMSVGGNAMLVTKMTKKVILDLAKQAQKGLFPTPIFINQMRTKIGVMYGSPDSMPGGNKLKHASALTLRLTGKDLIDPAINKDRPAYKEVSGSIVKTKVPTLHKTFKFQYPIINQGGLHVGEIDDWNTIAAQLKDLGWMVKEGQKVHFNNQTFPTFKAVRELLYSDPALIANVRGQIMAARMGEVYNVE